MTSLFYMEQSVIFNYYFVPVVLNHYKNNIVFFLRVQIYYKFQVHFYETLPNHNIKIKIERDNWFI